MDTKQIKKEISAFFDEVLKNQREIRTSVEKIFQSLGDEFKQKIASKYQVLADDDTFMKRMQATFLVDIESLTTDCIRRIRELHQKYKIMMRHHRALSDDWKGHRDALQFATWYKKLVEDVLQEKKNFIKEVEENAGEISKKAESMLPRFEHNVSLKDKVKEAQTIITWMSEADGGEWMKMVMED